MNAVREAIFDDLEARLVAVDGVAEVERMPSADPASFPALHLFDLGHTPGEDAAGFTNYDLSITVEGYVERNGAEKPHTALNQLYADTVAALMADPLPPGVETIDEGAMRVDIAQLASVDALAFSIEFNLTFFAVRGDPAKPA